MRYRISNKWGDTLGFIKEMDCSFWVYLLLPFAPLLLIAGIVGLFYLSFVLVSFMLSALSSGGTLSYEIGGLCVATLLSWVIAYISFVFPKEQNFEKGFGFAMTIIPIRNLYTYCCFVNNRRHYL